MSGHPGWYVDGQMAGRRAAAIRSDGPDLLIELDGGDRLVRWPLHEIRTLPDQAGGDQIILQVPENEARLTVCRPEVIRWVRQACPMLEVRPRDALGMRRLMIWAMAALGAFAALLFVVIPGLAGWLAPMVPAEAEDALGRQIRTQAAAVLAFGNPETRYCTNPEGIGALQVMADRLVGAQPLPADLKLAVVDSEVVNAFAMPGGYIVVLRGLIEEAGSAEEVAAVLAHEIGHVAARDPIRMALRSAGSAGLLSMALGDFIGGSVIATVSSHLIDASYSRRAEVAADAFGARMLAGAGVAPDALARFFDRLAEAAPDEPGPPGYFASHPPPEARSAAIRQSGEPTRTRPILSDAQWAALQSICTRLGPSP